jgi:hypothetical protein
MTEIHVQTLLRKWAAHTQQALIDYSECFRVLYQDPNRQPRDTEFVLGQLQVRATSTSDSVLFIVPEMKLWDAEILLRSVMEATLKFVFICTADEAERCVRVNEFLNVLPKITGLRRHRRAKDFLNRLPDNSGFLGQKPMGDVLLPDQEVAEISEAFPKEMRARLEGKWGFAQMAESIGRADNRFQELQGLLYSYGRNRSPACSQAQVCMEVMGFER